MPSRNCPAGGTASRAASRVGNPPVWSSVPPGRSKSNAPRSRSTMKSKDAWSSITMATVLSFPIHRCRSSMGTSSYRLTPSKTRCTGTMCWQKSSAEGRIVRILDRAHPSIVGLFRYGPHGNTVLPYDVRIQHEVEIPRGQELTPGLWKKLGFSGSDETSIRGRRIPHLDELDGAVVNVELVRYPRGGAPPTGRVIEILGRPGELGVDIEIIIRKQI